MQTVRGKQVVVLEAVIVKRRGKEVAYIPVSVGRKVQVAAMRLARKVRLAVTQVKYIVGGMSR